MKLAQREDIEIAKKQGKYRGRKKRFHAEVTGKDEIIFDEIVKSLSAVTSVMDIHRKMRVARSTICNIKSDFMK